MDEDNDNQSSNIDPPVKSEHTACRTHKHTRSTSGPRPKLNRVDGKRVYLRIRKNRSLKETMPVQCDICGQTITGSYNLTVHKQRMHDKVRNAKCSICSEEFFGECSLEKHTLRIHTRQCTVCDEYLVETVPWSYGMDKKSPRDIVCSCGAVVRIVTHFGRTSTYFKSDKPRATSNFACSQCGKLFPDRIECKRHSLSHTDVKRHVCDVCGNQYQSSWSLVNHLTKAHGVMAHPCDICGKNFQSEMTYNIHMTRYHAEPSDKGNESVSADGRKALSGD